MPGHVGAGQSCVIRPLAFEPYGGVTKATLQTINQATDMYADNHLNSDLDATSRACFKAKHRYIIATLLQIGTAQMIINIPLGKSTGKRSTLFGSSRSMRIVYPAADGCQDIPSLPGPPTSTSDGQDHSSSSQRSTSGLRGRKKPARKKIGKSATVGGVSLRDRLPAGARLASGKLVPSQSLLRGRGVS